VAVNARQYLSVAPYSRLTFGGGDDASFRTYMLRELKSIQRTLGDLVEASVQTLDVAPIVAPRYGTMRYAIGGWATALGGVGLYIYKDDNAWHKII
jgi:hypothetical protein